MVSEMGWEGEGIFLTIHELNTFFFEIGFNWKNDRIVLIVWCSIDAREGVDTGEFVDESPQVTLELYGAVASVRC